MADDSTSPTASPKPGHADSGPKEPWERDPSPPEWVDAAEDALAVALRAAHGEAIESARSYAGDLTFKVRLEAIAVVAATLKEEHGFDLLIDICGTDYSAQAARAPRFDVVYHAYASLSGRRVRLKVGTDEETPVPTLCGVWRGANWPEREVFDMYGVRFAGHPDMTRILLWDGFNGYPLRKDFPVEGIDTGAAAYPESYGPSAGPVAGSGTGWKPKGAAPPAKPATKPVVPVERKES